MPLSELRNDAIASRHSPPDLTGPDRAISGGAENTRISEPRLFKGPFCTALTREKTALTLAYMEKQFFLALAYLYENVW